MSVALSPIMSIIEVMKGYEIRQIMTDSGLKVSGIANELGVKQPTVSQIIHGRRKSARIMGYISKKLDMPITFLWPPDRRQ